MRAAVYNGVPAADGEHLRIEELSPPSGKRGMCCGGTRGIPAIGGTRIIPLQIGEQIPPHLLNLTV